MKKLLSLLLCAILLVSSLPAFATENVLLGDVTADGVIDNKDVHKLGEYLADYKNKISDVTLADVNQDGKISSADLLALTKLIENYAPTKKHGPIIILKADDLKLDSYKHATKMYNILKEEGITSVSFGIIGKKCSGEGEDVFWETVKGYIDSGAEIWHHGWEHKIDGDTNSEFSGAYDYAKMKENVKLTLDLVEEKTGYKITTIGAPGNKVNAEFAKMLNAEFPQIDKIFFSKNKNFNAFKLDSAIYPESGTNGVTYEHFLSVYKPNAKYSVVQFHPHRLKAYDLWDEFRLMIRYLKEQNCIFMTPEEYKNYIYKK